VDEREMARDVAVGALVNFGQHGAEPSDVHGGVIQPGAEPGDQPGRALRLGAAHHGSAVRQLGHRQQRSVPAVDPVEMHVGAAEGHRERPGDGAQQL
jgi:hypothetical protein